MQPRYLDWSRQYSSFRTPVFGRSVVATSQPLAARAGIDALVRGGNAVDAALTAAITLTVVEPTMNGVGGDAFAQIWDGQRLHGLNASGRAPKAWNGEAFSRYTEMPMAGWDSVTVPGAVSAWIALSRRFGVLPFTELFRSAIDYARNGFIVPPYIARTWSEAAERHSRFPSFAATFMPGGRPPETGELFRNEALADTLEEIASTFGESFYRGRLARRIASFARDTGGLLDEEDLAMHRPEWVAPLAVDFGEYALHEIPPNSQGIAALVALQLLNGTRIADMSPDSAAGIELQLRAMRVAQEVVAMEVADPEHMPRAVDSLLSDEYIERLRCRMSDVPRPAITEKDSHSDGDTVYLTAADAGGVMVSYIQSNYYDFGSGLVVPETGISLHSRAACFGLDPKHPNHVAGGKRPFHTLCPAFVTSRGRPVMSFGVMGGHMQPQGHVQTFLRVCGHGQNPQSACDAPRWHVTPDGTVLLEAGFADSIMPRLQELGYRVQGAPYGDPVFGGGQFALVLPDGYCGASDPRKDGQTVAI